MIEKKLKIRLCLFITFLVLLFDNIYSQTYKVWFLNSEFENCGITAMGFSKRSYYSDTAAFRIAFLNACENFVRNENSYFIGGQAFWSTEMGTAWMGNNFQLIYDTSRIEVIKDKLIVIDTLISENFVAVLVSDCECSLPNELKQIKTLNYFRKPTWIDQIPSDEKFIYALGISPEYYNEINSWISSEKEAIKSLAFQFKFSINALLKKENITGEIIKEEQTEVNLKNLQVVGRWRDSNQKIFYTLIRMPKPK